MFGDVIIPTKESEELATRMLNYLDTKLNHKEVVCIGGCSGSYKTEAAYALQNKLFDLDSIRSLVISLDDFYITHPKDRNNLRVIRGINSIGKQEIDWYVLHSLVFSFYNSNRYQYKVYSKYVKDYISLTINFKNVDVLIIEGLYTLHTEVSPSLSHKIHIDVTPKDTKAFRLLRNKENEKEEFRSQIVQREYEEVLSLKNKADLIIKW